MLPPRLPVPDIHERLHTFFPEGTENRNYVPREIAAKTDFVMLYIGAVAGSERRLRPDQVMQMTNAQAVLVERAAREAGLLSEPGHIVVFHGGAESEPMWLSDLM